MNAPIIGITTWRRPIMTQVGDGRPAHTLGVEYSDAVARAGGMPVLLPPCADPAAILDRIDGLLLSGGEDIDPVRYGARAEQRKSYSADRDEFEVELARLAQQRRMPTLAICRGMQIANVALGGTLIVDLPRSSAHERVVDGSAQLGQRHEVRFSPASLLAEIYGADRRIVNTIHHQALDTVAEGLIVTGCASDDVIEAAESRDPDWYLLAVQWHPEKMTEAGERTQEHALFAAFVETAARARRG